MPSFSPGRWFSSQSGNVSVMFALFSVPIVMMAGSGVDLMMHERERVGLQDALDSGLIAAAALAQPQDAETTVRSYINAAGFRDYTLTVTEKKTVSSRNVVATATKPISTTFMKLASINTLNVTATGSSEEAYKNIELSFVLDLSGSMHSGKPSRIDTLRPAAKNFIDQLLNDKTKSYTTISLIPFAGQVNVGYAAFDAFKGSASLRTHDRSSCFNNLENTYTEAIPDFATTPQVPQFSTWAATKNVINGKTFDPWNCPTEETSISYLSNDAMALKARIDGYHLFDGTGTHISMKWGLHLLDPGFRTLLSNAKAQGVTLASPGFTDRPADWGDSKTLKVIVLMTDGEVVAQQRPKIVNPPRADYTPDPAGVYPQFPANGSSGTYNENKLSDTKAIENMVAACTAAKNRGVVIYAIGFEVPAGNFTTKLQGCASGADKYYAAKTSDISKIFEDVARSITPLRLTN